MRPIERILQLHTLEFQVATTVRQSGQYRVTNEPTPSQHGVNQSPFFVTSFSVILVTDHH